MQLTAYVVSCLVLYLTPILLLNGSPVTLLFTYYQWMMVFAAIPLAMYNGGAGEFPALAVLLVLPGACVPAVGAGGPAAEGMTW